MYIDLIVILVIIIFCGFYFRRFSNVVYSIVIIDIFLRIMNFIANNIGLADVSAVINKYFVDSLEVMIKNYTAGIFEIILLWIYCIIYAIFLSYIVRLFVKRKK